MFYQQNNEYMKLFHIYPRNGYYVEIWFTLRGHGMLLNSMLFHYLADEEVEVDKWVMIKPKGIIYPLLFLCNTER